MEYYIIIDTDGGMVFYIKGISASIPELALEISESDYYSYMNNPGEYFFELINGVATLVKLTTIYIVSNYGLTITNAKSNAVIPVGSISFSSYPTTEQLSEAYPSVGGQITSTLLKNISNGDIISVCDISITAGTDFVIGSTLISTVQNIVDTLITKKQISTIYEITTPATPDGTFTLSEKIQGNKSTPTETESTDGTEISNSIITNSVYGYKNAYMCQQLKILTATYVSKLTEIKRGLLDAYTLDNATSVTALKSLRSSVVEEYNTKAKAIING